MVKQVKKKILIITSIVVVLDQIIKIIISNTIRLHEVVSIIPNFFYLTFTKNTGGAWSILNNNTYLLTIVSFICLLYIIKYILKKDNYQFLETIYLSLLTGGILGNFIDRLIYQYVIDFIGLQLGSYYFPIFNIADMAIVTGVFLMIYESIRRDKDES
ncbi:MAG: signal peptidase II [Firmicutes bacterium]|nr:signal peptidase II [Bacillota bacterium]